MPEPSPYCVVLCARANSERLPNKALAELAPGVTVLSQLLQRWRQSDRAPTLILATPEGAVNDPLAAVAAAHGVPVSRSAPGNAVAEMDAAVRQFAPGAKFVARALADNPLVDIGLADWRLDVLAETGAEGLWYGGDHDRITYCGTTDVWNRAAWDRIAAESSGCQLAHPGALYWDKLSTFNVVQLPLPRREFVDSFRTELDTPLDLEVFRAVWAAWGDSGKADLQWAAGMPYVKVADGPPALWALRWLAAHPQVSGLNAAVRVKTQTRAAFGLREKAWLCEGCRQRVGSIKEGNLQVYCPGCGRPKKFFAVRPRGKVDMGWVP